MRENKNNARLKKLWSAVAILALGIVLLVAAACRNEGAKSVSRPGSRGNDVFLIQQRLTELGFYTGELDGVFDLETQRALLKFQQENDLDASGGADEETLEKLGVGRDPLSQYSDVQLLARFIEWKAGAGSYIEKLTAGAVVLNRMADPSYPDTVAGVVFQSGEFEGFSTRVYECEPSGSSLKAAEDCVDGADPTGGKTEF